MRPISVFLTAIALVLTACSAPDREDDAEQLERAVRELPTVSDTLLTYLNGFDQGQRVMVTATLRPTVDHADVERVHDTFTEELDEVDLDEYDLSLTLDMGRSRLELEQFDTSTMDDDSVGAHVERWSDVREVDGVRAVVGSAYPTSVESDESALEGSFDVLLSPRAGLDGIRTAYRHLRGSVDGDAGFTWRVIAGSKVAEFDRGLPSRAQIAAIG